MKTIRFLTVGVTIGIALALSACRLPDDQFRIKGTVEFRNIEEGCWLVVDGGGHVYEPTNLPNEFKVDQLRIEIIASHNTSAGSYCMVGERVDVVSIQKQ